MSVTADHSACAYPWQQMNIDLTGEVVPCCFWSGYGNKGKPLGNTNEQSLEEIWNGPAYRALRQANASGDPKPGHPCHQCMAWKWSGGHYPGFTWPGLFRSDEGHSWTLQIPAAFRDEIAGRDEPVLLLEDGEPLPHADALHADIRQLGLGRYSVWGDTLLLSSSDNSDPRRNGRDYDLLCGDVRRRLATGLRTDSDSGRNLQTAFDEYDRGDQVMTAKPSLISFIATSDCNIDCPSCSQNFVRLLKVQHRGETELEIMALVPHLLQLIWHGGEPYLIRHFREFVDGFSAEDNPNLTFGFTSNGTLLDEAELDKLSRFPRVNASVSIDSFVEATFHEIRKGATFDNVLRNTLRAVARYDEPDFVVSVGMIINKRNLLELPENLRFAMQHGVGLNLSPVVVVPVHDRLDVFSDFATQTAGWREALDEADAVLAEARAQDKVALHRVDPTGMVAALRELYETAAARYAETVDVELLLTDPQESLPLMHHAGVLVAREGQLESPLAYVETPEQGRYTLRLPRGELSGGSSLAWYLVHDLDEASGYIEFDSFYDDQDRPVHESGFGVFPTSLAIEVPSFKPVRRERRNAKVAHFGLPTGDGLNVLDGDSMGAAYEEFRTAELLSGDGLQPWQGHGDPREGMARRALLLRPLRHRSFVSLSD